MPQYYNENLNSLVRNIKGACYKAYERFGFIKRGELLYYLGEERFNLNGQLIASANSISPMKNDQLIHFEKTYDNRNNIIKEIGRDAKGNICSETYNTYSLSNELLIIQYYIPHKLQVVIYNKYDTLSNLIEACDYCSSPRSFCKHTYKYDTENRQIEHKHYVSEYSNNIIQVEKFHNENKSTEILRTNLNGTFHSKLLYNIDSKNRVISFEAKFSDGCLTSEKTTTYLTDENCKIEQFHNKDRVITSSKIEYFDSNKILIIADNYTSNNKLFSKSLFLENGLVSKIEYFGTSGKIESIFEYKYSFDKKYNWTKKVEYLNSKPTNITIREILYHHEY
ncbi:MAG: hypothetical protein IPI31_10775 [Bacteroidetes bacterium]|nr:hypothetical protein [Bacteroidota bacterium]